jgi:hypothetical protein
VKRSKANSFQVFYTMDGALSPIFNISRVLATFGYTHKSPVLQTLNKIYCFAMWCFLNYANIQVVRKMYKKLEAKAQQGSKTENIIINYGALIFFLFVFLFNWIILYLTLFGSNKIDGFVAELKTIAADLNCEQKVAKNTRVFLLKYIALFAISIILCVHQDLSIWNQDLHFDNHLLVVYSSMARMIWQEIQLTTFAHITEQLLKEINSRITVSA